MMDPTEVNVVKTRRRELLNANRMKAQHERRLRRSLVKALDDLVMEMGEQGLLGYLDPTSMSYKMLSKRLKYAEAVLRIARRS